MQKLNAIKKFDYNIHNIQEMLNLLHDTEYIKSTSEYIHTNTFIEGYKKEHNIDSNIDISDILNNVYNILDNIRGVLKLDVDILYKEVLKK